MIESGQKRAGTGGSAGGGPATGSSPRASNKSRVRSRSHDAEDGPGWTFLSNHSHVLIALARDPHRALRDVALDVGITERSVQRIVADLEEGGYIEKERVGRGNRYRISRGLRLRHPLEEHCAVDDLLALIVPEAEL